MLSFGSASSALPHHQEVLDRLRRTSAQLDTLQRRLAFERVYEEGRWKNGADAASCSSGWSDVGRGQATKAVSALVDVVEEHAVRSYMDLPVGDGCFSSNALRLLRKKQNVSYIGARRPPCPHADPRRLARTPAAQGSTSSGRSSSTTWSSGTTLRS